MLQSSNSQLQKWGRHFLIGFRDPSEIETLVGKGVIGGVYISAYNVKEKSPQKIREWIESLQQLQAAQNLPPLVIACDQEGGIVSHLSPPLPKYPPLSSFAETIDSEGSFAFGKRQGTELASLGVTMNFSPVVDVKRYSENHALDRLSKISSRSISDDPKVVTEIATAYSSGLLQAGITPVAKHFPGLGGVLTDTHLLGQG